MISKVIANSNCLQSKLTKASSSSPLSSLLRITEPQKPKPLPNPLYNFLPDAQNPNKTVNLICSALKQHDSASHLGLIRKTIQEQGISGQFTTHEVSRVLLRCQSDSSSALTFFNWVKTDLGMSPNTHNYCIVVHILVWCRVFSQAMKILTELVEWSKDCLGRGDVFKNLLMCCEECNWDPVVFDMLIKAYLKVGLVKEGYRVFREMVKLGFSPDVITINCLLNGLKSGDGIRCWKVYTDMERIGVHPNACTINMLTHVLCKEGDVEKVNEFLEKMEEEWFDADIYTYNMLIDSFCKGGRLKDAFYLYKIMSRRRIMPDLVTYTSLINGLCKGGHIRDAHQLFHTMVHRGLEPDVICYNTLVYGYCKEGMMREARALLHDMVGSGVSPDNFTSWMLVEGYRKQDRLTSALNLVVELQKFGFSISGDLYNHLIITLCKDNRPFAAMSFIEQISHGGYEPSVAVYNELIVALCNTDYVEEALCLKYKMLSKNMKLNLCMYRAIISSLCRSSRSIDAESLMMKMIDLGMQPDTEIVRALISGYCKESNFYKAESLLCFFANKFQVFDNVCYNEIVKILSDERDIGRLMEFQNKMVKLGFVSNSLTCKYVIDGLQKTMGVR